MSKKVKVFDGSYELMEPSHLVDSAYLEKARGGISTSGCCCFFTLLIALILYILLDGWVGIIPGVNTGVWRYVPIPKVV